MSKYIHNHDNSIADESKTLLITTLEDCRGSECTYTSDRDVIYNALSDFSGDASVKMEVSKDPTDEGLVLTLSDNLVQPATSASQVHSNMIGCTERDGEGWLWYSRGGFVLNKNGGRGFYENNI